MTTRSQVLRQAVQVSEPLARTGFQVVECALQLSDYGRAQRARILYNHLYFSALPRQVLRNYVRGKKYWETVDHPNFSPRIVELAIKRSYTTANAFSQSLSQALDRPLDLYRIMFVSSMSDVAQRIVLSLVTFPTQGVRPDILKAVARGTAEPTEYSGALRMLEGTFIKVGVDRRGGGAQISYADPSVRDFTLAFLDEEADYLLDLVARAQSVDQIRAVLEYVSSVDEERYKFPRCAEIVTLNQSLVVKRVEEIIRQAEVLDESSRRFGSNLANTATAPLIRSLKPASQLMPDSLDALLRAVEELIKGPSAEYLDTEDLQIFCESLIEIRAESLIDSRESLERALECWGEALGYLEHVEIYEEFFGRLRASPSYWKDLDTILRAAVARGLWADLDLLNTAPNDLEPHDVAGVRNHLKEVEEMARRIGVLDLIVDELDRARSVDDGRSAEPGDTDVAQAPMPNRPIARIPTADQVDIDEIFRELS